MNFKEENICRLCCNIPDGEFEIVDEVTKEIFKGVLLNVNLDITEGPIICKYCYDILKMFFLFKTTYLEAKNFVSSVKDADETRFDVKNEFLKSENTSYVNITDVGTCRFCRKPTEECNLVTFDTIKKNIVFMEELLLKFVPEVDIRDVNEVKICTTCIQALETYYNFALNCLNIEERINEYCILQGTNSRGRVKLSNISQYIARNMPRGNDKCNATNVLKEEPDLIDVEDLKLCAEPTKIKKEPGIDNKDYILNKEMSESASGISLYTCSVCMFKTTKSSLKRHMLSHKMPSEVRMYKCTLCAFETKYKYGVKTHMLTHKSPSELTMFKCATCPFETKYKYDLKNHMISHLPTIHRCPKCTYETNYKKCFDNHLIIHKDKLEVTLYKCRSCTYETRHKHNLKKHMLTHKSPSEAAVYKCLLCDCRTKYKYYLNQHIKTHTMPPPPPSVYKCASCRYETKNKECLRSHMAVHRDPSTMTKYKCALCSHETRNKYKLVRHMLVHKSPEQIPMFKCTVCPHETKNKYNLKVHMLTHKIG